MSNSYPLNESQLEAVHHSRGPLIILAGAGTGKTSVITRRIAHLIKHKKVEPKKILSLTFTNKAAKEMKERTRLLLKSSKLDIETGTFHSVCLRWLRKYHKEAGLPSRFSIVGTSDQIELVKKSMEEARLAGQFRADLIHNAISQCKNKLWSNEDVKKNAETAFPQLAAILPDMFSLYERQLKLNQVIDFDDCIYRTALMLQNSKEVQKKLSDSYSQIMVDEYQDTNDSQLKLIELLGSKHKNVCVVGDDDQCIYSWRGASSEIFRKFEKIFPNRTLIKLENNYRSTKIILDAANAVIQKNAGRYDKNLKSNKDSDAPIEIVERESASSEASFVAQKCLTALGNGAKLSDIAVLYRANAQARPIEMALRDARLRYKVFGGQSFFEKAEVKDILGYLSLVENSNQKLPFWRIINRPSRGIGLKVQEQIADLAKSKRTSPYKILKNIESTDLPKRYHKPALEFVDKIERLSNTKLRSPEDFRELVSDTIKEFKLKTHYQKTATSTSQAEKKREILAQCPGWFESAAKNFQSENEKLNLTEIVESLTLRETETDNEEKDQGDYISLMTVHSAKGLEFPYVFVIGLEEGSFPHRNSQSALELEEERRLFYVAMTRAKDHLYLTHSKYLLHHNRQQSALTKSRFLGDLPGEVTQASKIKELTKEERSQRTRSRLSKIRSEISANP